MTTKHTPGPWVIGAEGEIYGPDVSGTMQYREIIPADTVLSDADASLIAAAPDLLAVVEAVAKYFADTDAPLGIQARAAIARAKG